MVGQINGHHGPTFIQDLNLLVWAFLLLHFFCFFGQNNSLDGNGEEKLLELLKDYWNISMSQRSDKQTKLLNI